jgi:hypothetical protein
MNKTDGTDISELIAGLDAHLTDEHVLSTVGQYLNAIEHKLEYDGETIVFAPDIEVRLLDKSLVVDRAWKSGAYLTARVVFDPVCDGGLYTGLSRGGTLKILFDLAGEMVDDVYSRANVIGDDD